MEKRKVNKKVVIICIGVLVIIGMVGLYVYDRSKKSEEFNYHSEITYTDNNVEITEAMSYENLDGLLIVTCTSNGEIVDSCENLENYDELYSDIYQQFENDGRGSWITKPSN